MGGEIKIAFLEQIIIMILSKIHINLMKISVGAEKLIFVTGINYRSGINFST